MSERYQATHEYQYADGNSARTRKSGCTWVTGATGADAVTGGAVDVPPDAVLAKVAPSEETNPATPGWSLNDLRLAMTRLGVPFQIRSGAGWSGVKAARAAGLYVVLQGDSDRFPDGCSGAFDGDHAIGIPPGSAIGEWAIDDPICRTRTTQPEAILRAYAEKFSPTVRFGVFTTPVPTIPEPAPPEEPMTIYSAPGLTSVTFPVGTPLLDAPDGTQVAAVTDKTARYDVMGQDAPKDPTHLLVDDRGIGIPLRWAKASSARDERSTPDGFFNQGVTAASAAALTAKRGAP